MSEKLYLNILKFGIYLSFFSVFLVFKSLLFPYITSKQIFFNILIEILFIFWLVFIIKYPNYRPKKSYITHGLFAFFAALIISCFFSVDLNLSFWGDVERMLGVFHLLHFLAFYLIIISVMKNWQDWKLLLIISIAFATIVSIIGLDGEKAYSTIGNTAYVSGYLIFNIYFVLLLFFKEENKNLRWLYLLFLPLFLIEFKKARTTGAFVGFGSSVIFLIILYIILFKNKKVKIYLTIISVVLISIATLLYVYKDSNFVANNSYLNLVREVSFQKSTFQTRLISWRTAAKDFSSHPIFGTGHGNFAIIFDKYFEPSFYDYTREETYFDRAHNNLVDIASTAGIIGLLTYFSIFAAVGYYLIQGYRKEKINVHEFIIIASLLAAYFIQNLTVFDSLVTYISLMMILGYIYWFYQKRDEEEVEEQNKGFINKEIFTFVIFGVIILTILYQFNYKPIKMLKGTIKGQLELAQGKVLEGVNVYKEALKYDTILDRDSRTSLIRTLTMIANNDQSLDKEEMKKILDYGIELAKENVNYNKKDSLAELQLAQILDVAARYNADTAEKFYYYSDQALGAVNQSVASSPGRIPIYYSKAQIQLNRGEIEEAIETYKYSVSLNENYYDSYCQLSMVYFRLDRQELGYQAMGDCIDKGGVGLLANGSYVASLINYYNEQGDKEKVLKLYQQLSNLESQNASVWVNLAKLYAELGEIENAISAATKAAELDKSLQSSVSEFIKGLE
ncbi:MAG: O-antigen ligase family protein [Patescibacteria group bacterium]